MVHYVRLCYSTAYSAILCYNTVYYVVLWGIGRGAEAGMGQVWPVRGIGRVSVGPVLGIGRKRAQIYENIIFTIIAARPPNSVRYLLHLRPIQPILFAIYYTCGPSTQFRSLCTAFAACPPNSVRYLLHLRPIQPIQFAIYYTCGTILRYIIVCYGILCEQQSVGLRRG
jgi:hypothetical protein